MLERKIKLIHVDEIDFNIFKITIKFWLKCRKFKYNISVMEKSSV